MSKCNAVILAGGFGTRLSQEFPGIPKPMVLIDGVPILERIIIECRTYGYTNILLILHHLPDQIIDYFGDGSDFDVEIMYHIETEPMGTGGALLSVQGFLTNVFLVLYADVFTTVNLSHFSDFHKNNSADISIVVHPNDHPFDSDLVVIDDSNRVVSFDAPPHDGFEILANLVNAALYIFNKDTLKDFKKSFEKFDIAQKLFPDLLNVGKKIFAYNTQEYIKDMGTPERRDRVEKDLCAGVVASRGLSVPREAIFIDRDGTINIEKGYLNKPNQLELIEGATLAINKVNRSKYLAVCITNQPVVARGECSMETLNTIHNYLEVLLGKKRAYLDALYFCPHHPDSGFDGEIPDLKKVCDCRKPEPGLLIRAASELNIKLSSSWMIGDRSGDVAAANKAGMLSALVETGAGGLDAKYPVRPHFIGSDINEVVDFILEDYPIYNIYLEKLVAKVECKKYLFISSLTEFGRNFWPTLIQRLFALKGKRAHIIELDRFLLEGQKASSNNLNAYNIKQIFHLLNKADTEVSFEIDDFGVDHLGGDLINYGKALVLADHIFIVVGTIAFDIEAQFNQKDTYNLFLKRTNENHYIKFNKKYDRNNFETYSLPKSRPPQAELFEKLQIDKADAIVNLQHSNIKVDSSV